MHLITPSLHDAFRWYGLLDSKTKADMLSYLRREERETPKAALRGIVFENDVQSCTRNVYGSEPDDAYGNCVREIAGTVAGGLWQQKLSRQILIQGQSFLLYGKPDVVKRDWIYDIKFSGSYEIGKYTPSVQHRSYMWMSGIRKFAYLISDGTNVWREDYFWEAQSEDELLSELTELMTSIFSDTDFRSAYLENWACRHYEKEAA